MVVRSWEYVAHTIGQRQERRHSSTTPSVLEEYTFIINKGIDNTCQSLVGPVYCGGSGFRKLDSRGHLTEPVYSKHRGNGRFKCPQGSRF